MEHAAMSARGEQGIRPMIVEVCGEPGAGKTAAAGLLVQAMRRSGVDALSDLDAIARCWSRGVLGRVGRRAGLRTDLAQRRQRWLLVELPWSCVAVLRHPSAVGIGIAAALREPVALRHRALIVQRLLLPLARLRYLRGRLRAGEVVIVDEGPVHRTVNLFAWRRRPADHAAIARYAHAIPLADVVVAVRASEGIATDRLIRRGLPGMLRGRPSAEVRRFRRHARHALEIATEVASHRTTLHRIDNDGTVDDLADALQGFSSALTRPGRSPASEPFDPVVPFALPRFDRLWARPAPGIAGDVIERMAVAYGIDAVGPPVAVGRGRSGTVLVPTRTGTLLVKRYKATLSDAAIAEEHAILRELQESSIPAPRLLASRHAATLHRVDGERLAAFHAVEGYVPLHERLLWPGEPTHVARLAGQVLAGLHEALERHQPDQVSPLGVDRDGARAVGSAWHRDQLLRRGSSSVGEDIERARVWAIDRLDVVDAELGAATLSTTVVHGDYGPYNLLARGGAPLLPVDFELARRDWRIVDLATAIPRFAQTRAGFRARRARAFLAAYASAGCWDVTERPLVPLVAEFLALRRAAVCWGRWQDGRGAEHLAEARSRMAYARRIAEGRDGLVDVCR
jgi:Ser/Thr protein kinase RdoA (MazF antagonist)